jgi:hypothetical protein
MRKYAFLGNAVLVASRLVGEVAVRAGGLEERLFQETAKEGRHVNHK